MGKRAISVYFSFMMLIITVLVMANTIIGIFGGHVTPVGNTWRAMAVYVLPFMIIANFIILLYWLLMRKWIWAALPAIALIFCIPYSRTIFQLGLFNGDSEEVLENETVPKIRICTYNVARFSHDVSGFISEDILSEMKRQDVNILCMQEYLDESGDHKNSDNFREYLPYMAVGEKDMAIFSKFPILRSEKISFGNTNNSALWADIQLDKRHIVRVFNVHLETTGFNRTLRQIAKARQQVGKTIEDNVIVRAVYQNYTVGMIIRAEQAEQVSRETKKSPYPIIIAGDFNDIPYSYVYNTMKDGVNDGFTKCGKGFMSTYRGGKKKARIDYIFTDKKFKGLKYYKVPLTYSDHEPVFMVLSYTPKGD